MGAKLLQNVLGLRPSTIANSDFQFLFPKFAKVIPGPTWPPGHLAIHAGKPEHFKHQNQDFNSWAQNYYKTYQVCAHPL